MHSFGNFNKKDYTGLLENVTEKYKLVKLMINIIKILLITQDNVAPITS